MDEVLLPFVPATMSLKDAIELLREKHIGALVTERTGQRVVLQTADLTDHWNDWVDAGRDGATVKVASVVPRARSMELPVELSFDDLEVRVLDEPGARGVLQTMFAARGHLHAISAVVGDKARVITISEAHAAALRGWLNPSVSAATIVACVGNPVHYWDPRDLRVPGQCNKPHGVTLQSEGGTL